MLLLLRYLVHSFYLWLWRLLLLLVGVGVAAAAAAFAAAALLPLGLVLVLLLLLLLLVRGPFKVAKPTYRAHGMYSAVALIEHPYRKPYGSHLASDHGSVYSSRLFQEVCCRAEGWILFWWAPYYYYYKYILYIYNYRKICPQKTLFELSRPPQKRATARGPTYVAGTSIGFGTEG